MRDGHPRRPLAVPMRWLLALPALPAAVSGVSASSQVHLAPAALHHLTGRYLVEWEKLYLREGADANYPMPAARETRDPAMAVCTSAPPTARFCNAPAASACALGCCS